MKVREMHLLCVLMVDAGLGRFELLSFTIRQNSFSLVCF